MNRGYAGFYKGFYLRSSYEYAYAKFLDFNSIPWRYEEITFDLGYKMYKPDFFIYNSAEDLVKIVEIKSRDKNAKEMALKSLKIIESKYKIPCELISYEELLRIYSCLPFTLNSTISEWINDDKTTINKSLYGSLNGHFNIMHSLATKKKIGENTKKLWNTNSPAKQKMLEGLRKSGLSQKGKIKTLRITKHCLKCGKEFQCLITSPKKFCSQQCSGSIAIKHATDQYVNQRNKVHGEIRDFIIKWSLENVDLILQTPMNKIKTSINPLVQEIEEQFGVKDLRVISKAVFGEDRGRKELINFMTKVCNEKIC
ncbi:restriction endonuclease [Neobacillus niacini]|uniref:restriction endonuclease n=1 Tax=Neobacillus niacini TaxID=86668 RepID=UPI003B02AF82